MDEIGLVCSPRSDNLRGNVCVMFRALYVVPPAPVVAAQPIEWISGSE